MSKNQNSEIFDKLCLYQWKINLLYCNLKNRILVEKLAYKDICIVPIMKKLRNRRGAGAEIGKIVDSIEKLQFNRYIAPQKHPKKENIGKIKDHFQRGWTADIIPRSILINANLSVCAPKMCCVNINHCPSGANRVKHAHSAHG